MTTQTWIRVALVVALGAGGTAAASAQSTKPMDQPGQTATATDNMTPYRTLASDALTAFKAQDMTTARKKAKDLETAWDKNEKALQKSSPDAWNQIDKAMDDFIKPLATKAPDAAKVQAAYDAFIAKLQMAVKK